MIRAIIWDLGGTLVNPPPGGQDLAPLDTYPGIRLRPGAAEAVKAMATKGYQQAILSNTAVSDDESVRRLLERLGIVQFFSVVRATRSELQPDRPGKPDAAVFIRVLNDLGVRAEEAAMVGNSWPHDIVGAVGVGILALWITNPEVSLGGPAMETEVHRVVEIDDVQQVGSQLDRFNRTDWPRFPKG